MYIYVVDPGRTWLLCVPFGLRFGTERREFQVH